MGQVFRFLHAALGGVGLLCAMALLSATCALAVDGPDLSDFSGSPLNYRNSEFNFDNATANPDNSPMNWNNNRQNPERLNVLGMKLLGLLDPVVGYAVIKKDGGVNYFDNDGDRIGYSPDGGANAYELDGDRTEFEVQKNVVE